MTLDEVNAMPAAEFVACLGGVFEHSPWVAEAVAQDRPFASVDALHAAMVRKVEAAGDERQLALICAHPDLAGKAALAGELTAESTGEQKGAGLDRLSVDEYAEFHRLNGCYQQCFGFPFIIAVRGHDRQSILAAFKARLEHDAAAEKAEALRQIARIAGFRLHDLVKG